MVKYGVIGVGALGRHHARWADDIKELDLAGVYDIDSDRCRKVADEIGCPACSSIDELLRQCDAVSIAVTTTNHCDVALQAIEAGKHVLIEKPIASTLDEADRIIAARTKNNIKLAVGHIERFNPALDALHLYDIRPRFIEAHRLAAFNPRGADVAVVLDLMIHDIDLALHLVGSPVTTISASAVAVISDTEDIANARLTFENGAVANLTASRISLKPMRKLRIFQSSGYFSLDLAEKRADLYRLLDNDSHDGEMAIPLGASGKNIGYRKGGDASIDMLRSELTSFAASIAQNTPVAVTGEDGRAALAVALQVIEESHNAAQKYKIDER